MSVMSRIGREYAAQLASFTVTLADRLLLAGILLRAWGADGFAAWSLATSAAGLVAFFDFGLNLYFGNKLAFLLERGLEAEARRVLRMGNLLMSAASLLGCLAICAIFPLYARWSGQMTIDAAHWGVTAMLAVATAAKMAMAVQNGLYRGHGEFGRITWVLAIGDFVRVFAVCLAAWLGAGPLTCALIYLLTMVASAVIYVLHDTRKRFPGYGFWIAVPGAGEKREIASTSLGYWIQSAPTTLLTFAPVFVLASMGGSGVLLSAFVLLRTLANFARAGLQLFGVVLGQEAARRTAIGDHAGLVTVYSEATILLGAQSAAAGGVLIVAGRPLFALWTGRADIYDPLLFWLALGPIIFLPTLIMAHNYFASVNRPWPIATGRMLQLLVTVIAFLLLPVREPAERMMAALAIGEILGFGVPVTAAIGRTIRGAGFLGTAIVALRGATCCALAAGITYAAAAALGDAQGLFPLVLILVAGGVGAGLSVLLFGVTSARRNTLMAILLRHTSRLSSRTRK